MVQKAPAYDLRKVVQMRLVKWLLGICAVGVLIRLHTLKALDRMGKGCYDVYVDDFPCKDFSSLDKSRVVFATISRRGEASVYTSLGALFY